MWIAEIQTETRQPFVRLFCILKKNFSKYICPLLISREKIPSKVKKLYFVFHVGENDGQGVKCIKSEMYFLKIVKCIKKSERNVFK
jgi:hypothetical protein